MVKEYIKSKDGDSVKVVENSGNDGGGFLSFVSDATTRGLARKVISTEDKGEFFQVYDERLDPEQKDVISRALESLRRKQDELEDEKKSEAARLKAAVELCEQLSRVLIRINSIGRRPVRKKVKIRYNVYENGKEIEFINPGTGEIVYRRNLSVGEQPPLMFKDEPDINPIYLDFDMNITLDPVSVKVKD